jgi:hypothetical protein
MTTLNGTAPGRPGQDAASPPAVGWALAAVFVVLAGLEHYLYAVHNGTVLKAGGLVDTDSYMRVLRILDLYNGTGWYNTVTLRVGAPEGLSLHWTRPVDILILLPALAAHLFGAGIPRAVYWSGAAFSTVCHILACLAVTWAARPLWPSPAHRFAAVILLANGTAFGYGVFGRADHHTLILLLTVLMVGGALRACLNHSHLNDSRRDRRMRYWGAIAGIYAGLGIWVSPEAMIPITPVIAVIGLFWLLDAERRDWAGTGAAFSLAMAGVICIAIPVEHAPAQWLATELDKVSAPYLVMPLLWFGVFAAARRIRGGIGRRLALGGLLAAIGAAILFALYPGLLYGPMGQLSARADRDLLAYIAEMQPLWPTSLVRLRSFLIFAGQSVAMVLLLPTALRIWWRDERRMAGILLTLAAAFLMVAALMHTRLNIEFAVAPAVICCGFFHLAEKRLNHASRLTRTPTLTLVAVALTVGPFILSLPLPATYEPPACKYGELANWLNTAHPGIGAAPIILTDDLYASPELAFRTGYRFVASPYHRNMQAIFDALDALTDQGDAKAREVFDRRQVSLITRCTDVSFAQLNKAGPNSFYAKLGRGEAPDWLRPLVLPANLAGHFKVYEAIGR